MFISHYGDVLRLHGDDDDDDHHYDFDYGHHDDDDHGHHKRRPRAGTQPVLSRDPRQSQGASLRSHGLAEYEETDRGFQSASVYYLNARPGARADWELYS